jgi:hypothetical protein
MKKKRVEPTQALAELDQLSELDAPVVDEPSKAGV